LTGALLAQDAPLLWQQVQAAIQSDQNDRIHDLLSEGAGPQQTAERYESVARSLYQTARDLPAVVLVARSGIAFNLSVAGEAAGRGDVATARLFQGSAKALAYNLASYTWPGWDEPGIGIRTADLDAGFEAARLNLRLAEQLGPGPEPMANGWFILAGHALAAGDYPAAREYFAEFERIAENADLRELDLLADGYRIIVDAAAGTGNPGTYMLEPVREQFREMLDSDADFWIDQLDTAWAIFVTG
jgi:hypothetical protein